MLHCVRNHQQGIILVTVLLFLQILAILGLYFMQNRIVIKKIAYSLLEQTNLFIAAETVIKKIENEAMATCLIPVTNQADLRKAPIVWWQSVGCAGVFNSLDYFYVTENLGVSELMTYFRVSLLIKNKITGAEELLQSTYRVDHNVTKDQQMWRELR